MYTDLDAVVENRSLSVGYLTVSCMGKRFAVSMGTCKLCLHRNTNILLSFPRPQLTPCSLRHSSHNNVPLLDTKHFFFSFFPRFLHFLKHVVLHFPSPAQYLLYNDSPLGFRIDISLCTVSSPSLIKQYNTISSSFNIFHALVNIIFTINSTILLT